MSSSASVERPSRNSAIATSIGAVGVDTPGESSHIAVADATPAGLGDRVQAIVRCAPAASGQPRRDYRYDQTMAGFMTWLAPALDRPDLPRRTDR